MVPNGFYWYLYDFIGTSWILLVLNGFYSIGTHMMILVPI